MSDSPPCVCCGQPSQGSYGPHRDDPLSVPVCDPCGESGRASAWWDKTILRIHAAAGNCAVETSTLAGKNLLEHLEFWEKYRLQETRLEDGVCPKGCARLESVGPSSKQCPVCGFTYHHSTLSLEP